MPPGVTRRLPIGLKKTCALSSLLRHVKRHIGIRVISATARFKFGRRGSMLLKEFWGTWASDVDSKQAPNAQYRFKEIVSRASTTCCGLFQWYRSKPASTTRHIEAPRNHVVTITNAATLRQVATDSVMANTTVHIGRSCACRAS